MIGHQNMDDDKSQEGFTLLEVLVSLVIATLMISAITHASGITFARRTSIYEEVDAMLLAHSLLANARSTGHLQNGAVRVGTTKGYRWRIYVTRLSMPSVLPQESTMPARSSAQDQASHRHPLSKGDKDESHPLNLYDVVVHIVTPSGHHEQSETLVAQPPRRTNSG